MSKSHKNKGINNVSINKIGLPNVMPTFLCRVVEKSQQNSRTITVFYDGWALMKCIVYRQENF